MARSRSQAVKPSAEARSSCIGKSVGLEGVKSTMMAFRTTKEATSTSSLYISHWDMGITSAGELVLLCNAVQTDCAAVFIDCVAG